MTVVGFYILIIFLAAAAIMFTRKLPALIVLPGMGILMAVGAAVITGDISVADITTGVVSKGAIRLHEAMIIAFFGGMLSFIMQKSGVAENLIKNGAELIGDNPFAVAVFSLGLIAMLFTSIGGLGAIIMVSMVVLPMMATVGIQPAVAGGVMLIGISVGGIMNPGNWVVFREVLKIETAAVQSFALITFFITSLAGVVFISVELYRTGTIRSLTRTLTTLAIVAAIGAGVLVGFFALKGDGTAAVDSATVASAVAGAEKASVVETIINWVKDNPIRTLFALFFTYIIVTHLLDIRRRIRRWRHQVVKIEWYAYLIPVVPLVLILVFKMEILAAFLIGFLYAVFVTVRPGFISLSIQSMITGASSVMPAVLLMIGIGILLTAVLGPSNWSASNGDQQWPVLAAIQPLFQKIIPNTPLGYIITFGLAAPLALYRGPLNLWGLGYGVASLLLASGSLPPEAIMAMLMVVGQIQGICDPTNTHNVWLANELRVDVQSLMWKTLPYIWGMVFIGLTVSAIHFGSQWKKPTTEFPAVSMVRMEVAK